MANVPHDLHVAVTSSRDEGAVEQGSVVVYQPSNSTAVWWAEYTTALDAMKPVCGCNVAWRPHAVYRPKAALSPELTASSAAPMGKVVHSHHSGVAWLEPHRYCWVPAATKVTSSDASPEEDMATNVVVASHGSPTWTGAIRGTVPEAEIIGAAVYLLHTPPVRVLGARSGCLHHWGAPTQSAGGLLPWHQGADLTSGQPACVELDSGGTAAAATQNGGPHHWVVRHSSHLAAVPLEESDFAAARAMAPPFHLLLPKEHAVFLVPREDGELEPHVPSTQALQQGREMEWRSLAARTRAHKPLAGACEAVPLGAVHHGPTHRKLLRARDGRLSTTQVM